ncbi:MAG: cob(I)yrinic acid a,c-diamide adenosyltransferase [Gracilibacteraceae bacterium]|jgi:cob(I)alamin adenosyltransferase|nr:cob(I)yrinic acid a,c-diamide adenosyltransferase [Gracilibacteraceae bacterium]
MKKDVKNLPGLLHVYIGYGKGKSTAALGLLLRAAGHGRRVLYGQFVKSGRSGEMKSLSLLGDQVKVWPTAQLQGFFSQLSQEEQAEATRAQRASLAEMAAEMGGGAYGLVIMDEALDLVDLGIVTAAELVELAAGRPQETELVFTGHNAGELIIEAADYVTEFAARKHPYNEGVPARRGIEF